MDAAEPKLRQSNRMTLPFSLHIIFLFKYFYNDIIVNEQ